MRPRPAAAAAQGRPIYWEWAWMIAAALSVLLVVRLAEAYPPLAALHPAVIGVVVSMLLLAARTRPAGWRAAVRDPQLRLTFAYCVLIMAAVPFGLWRGGSMPTILALPYVFILTLSMMLVSPGRQDLDRVVNWCVLGGGVFAFFTGAIARVKWDVVGGRRLSTSGMYDPNDLAAMLGIFIQLAIGMSMRTRGRWRLMALTSLGMMIWIFIKTGSRGGIVALVVATSVILIAQNVRRFLMLTVAIAVVLPALWAFGPRTFRDRTKSMLTLEEDYSYTAQDGRMEIWKRGLGYFARSPIIGAGPNNFPIRDGHGLVSEGLGGAWLTAHNSYVQVLVELGLFGTLAMLGMLWQGARDAAPLWRPRANSPNPLNRPEILTALISFATSAVFLSHAYSYLLFFVVGLCALARRVSVAEGAAIRGWQPMRLAAGRARGLRGGGVPARLRGAALPTQRS